MKKLLTATLFIVALLGTGLSATEVAKSKKTTLRADDKAPVIELQGVELNKEDPAIPDDYSYASIGTEYNTITITAKVTDDSEISEVSASGDFMDYEEDETKSISIEFPKTELTNKGNGEYSIKITLPKEYGLDIEAYSYIRFYAVDASGNETYETLQNGEICGDLVIDWLLPRTNDSSIDPTETKEIALIGNYPNPFNPTTSINFTTKVAGLVNLAVYNAQGQLIKTLVNDFQQAGNHSVDFSGHNLNSGIYFYQLKMQNTLLKGKMVLVK